MIRGRVEMVLEYVSNYFHKFLKYILTIDSYCSLYVLIHPRRGLGHDGGFDGVDMALARGV